MSNFESFIASRGRYVKAAARKQLTATLPMSPDFSKLIGLNGQASISRHGLIESLVSQGAKVVTCKEREIRGSTMYITIGRALTIPMKPGSVWSMSEAGKYAEAYALHLGAPVEPDEE